MFPYLCEKKMKRTIFFIMAFCCFLVSCKKDYKFIEGQYFTTYKGEELVFHIYEYDDGKLGWMLNSTDVPSNLLGGTVTISFEGKDTLASFTGILVGDNYKGSFVGLNEQTEKVLYRHFDDMDIMKFSPIGYVFTKSHIQPQEREKRIMINVMREKFVFEEDKNQ